MNNFNAHVTIIDKFTQNFKGQFSKKQFAAFTAILYALVNEYKRVNISSLAKAIDLDYERLQYFLSESKWNYQAVNAQRIELLKNQRTTGFSKEGALIIDDALEKKVLFRYCLFDSWYSASDVLNFIHEKNLRFITEVKSDRRMLFNNPVTKKGYFTNQDELVMLIKKHLWDKTRVIKHRGRNLAVYSFSSRLKSTDFKVKVFVVFGNLSSEDKCDVRIIVTNDLSLSEKEAVLTYFERWAIERLFRELKDSLL